MSRTIALTGFAALIAAMTLAATPPARAQLGNVFSDPAPRPPGNVPRGQQVQQQQQPDDDEEVPELPQGRLLPAPNRPPPGQGVPPPGAVQSQPLAPPPRGGGGSPPRAPPAGSECLPGEGARRHCGRAAAAGAAGSGRCGRAA